MRLDEAPSVLQLKEKLSKANDSISSISEVFRTHVASDFLSYLISNELSKLARNTSHVVLGGVGQTSLKLIANSDFEYEVRYCYADPDTQEFPSLSVWTGDRHLISVKGKGRARLQICEIPHETNINEFQHDLVVDNVNYKYLQENDPLFVTRTTQFLNFIGFDGELVVELLTVRNKNALFHWMFDKQMRTMFSSSASMLASRLGVMFDIIEAASLDLEDSDIVTIFRNGDTQLKLRVIQKLLRENRQEGFTQLSNAFNSQDPALLAGAWRIINAMSLSPNLEE